MIRVTGTIVLDDREGQRVFRPRNGSVEGMSTVATAVELRVCILRSSLPPDGKGRLRRRMCSGWIVAVG
jgi:hypothetical protein